MKLITGGEKQENQIERRKEEGWNEKEAQDKRILKKKIGMEIK